MADITHVASIHLSCFVNPIPSLGSAHNIRIDLLFINIRSQHPTNEVKHCLILVVLLEALHDLDCANVYVHRHQISAELCVDPLQTDLLSVETEQSFTICFNLQNLACETVQNVYLSRQTMLKCRSQHYIFQLGFLLEVVVCHLLQIDIGHTISMQEQEVL